MTSYRRYNVYTPGRPASTGPPRYRRNILITAVVLSVMLGLVVYQTYSARVAAREAAAKAVRLERQGRFASKLESLITETKDVSISVSAIDLKTGAAQTIGDKHPETAASTTKLLSACLYLKQVEQGRRSLNAQVSGYSGRQAIRQLINRSDDKVWKDLDSMLGQPALKAYALRIGLNDYDPSTNRISSQSMASLLKQMYEGKLLNPANTELVLSSMQRTNYEDFIPPAVPNDIRLYHKVGLYEDQVNDAAIIDDGNMSFVLVIYTNGKGSYNWGKRAELMQKITSLAISAYLGRDVL